MSAGKVTPYLEFEVRGLEINFSETTGATEVDMRREIRKKTTSEVMTPIRVDP